MEINRYVFIRLIWYTCDLYNYKIYKHQDKDDDMTLVVMKKTLF